MNKISIIEKKRIMEYNKITQKNCIAVNGIK